VETYWDNLSKFTSGIAEAMTQLGVGLRELDDYDIEEYDDLLVSVTAAARHLAELHLRLDQLVVSPDQNTVYWVEFQPDGARISVHAAPLDIGPLVQKHVWHAKEAVIMTSATLRSDESFSYIRERLDAAEVNEVIVESPFDYESSTLVYLLNDIPEPTEPTYQRAVEQGITSLCRATEGRSLILFTSYAQLRQTSNAVSDALARSGIVVYDQSDGSSRSQLLEGFVESEKAVLMGTRSFWEGVDVPGEDLSVLVIVRLPFSVPTDPLFAARSELFDNPFAQYAIPETILRFRQGFGRLIRRKDDRGVVAIFDRRVLTKQYGRLFLDALPRCTVKRGSLADLPSAAARWITGS
jgi:DNA polymerase-3 subunit epsilon/ATP-dependent DNA helicase DinG